VIFRPCACINGTFIGILRFVYRLRPGQRRGATALLGNPILAALLRQLLEARGHRNRGSGGPAALPRAESGGSSGKWGGSGSPAINMPM